MTVHIATATRNAMLDAVSTKIDAGSAGYLEIRTGSQPATANTAASGTLLVTITLKDPCVASGASSGTLTIDVSGTAPSGTAGNTGTAGWGRVYDSAANAIFDGSVTASGGGGEFIISSTSITSGQTVTLTATTISLAA